MLDGRINNTPSVAELEAKIKAGETISLTDLAAAVKNERKTERGKPQKNRPHGRSSKLTRTRSARNRRPRAEQTIWRYVHEQIYR